MRRTTLAALCLTAVTVAGVAGCLPGEDKAADKTADKTTAAEPKGPFAGLTGGEIAERALAATSGASSLRMTGDVPDDESGGTIRIDMALDKRGECAGTMSMNGEGKADVVKTGTTLYMKYDEKFLRAQSDGSSKEETDGVVAMLAGKWTKMAATGADAKDIAGFCDLDSVLADFKDAGSGPGAGVTRGATTTVDGTPPSSSTRRTARTVTRCTSPRRASPTSSGSKASRQRTWGPSPSASTTSRSRPRSPPARSSTWTRWADSGPHQSQLVPHPHIGLYVDPVPVFEVAPHRCQRPGHLHLALAVEGQPGPGVPLLQ